MSVTNAAAYRFAALSGLRELRQELVSFCKALALKGTILLSPEGVNLFVAGSREAVDSLLERLRNIEGLEALVAKYSESESQPFRRMLVRLKREIIAFGVPGIDPARRPSPKLAPAVLKKWLDEGRRVTLLDTRNEYEVKLGTFDGALSAGIHNFRQFPEAVRKLAPEMKEEPIVMFCTGGIRCEKAGPFMEKEGFRTVFQLEGGILKYFEECGGAHYHGECFVFDQRVGVDPALQETDSTHCFPCLTPLTLEEQMDPRFEPGRSCPHCYVSPEAKAERHLRAREEAIRAAASPLPGSVPYENRRPFSISARLDGTRLDEALLMAFPHVSAEEWNALFADERLISDRGEPARAARVVRAGERYYRVDRESVEPDVSGEISLLYEDDALIAVNKPAPLPVHPSGRYHRNTLQHLLSIAYAPEKPRPVHRLDSDTTGVVVFARTRHFARILQPQFAEGRAKKRYLACVERWPFPDTHACEAPIGVSPCESGAREVDPEGQPARTDFNVLERAADGAVLLEALPLTGRTNQIRLHLSLLGSPIRGDRPYAENGRAGAALTSSLGSPPLQLHAWQLRLEHPKRDEPLVLTADLPAWVRNFQFFAAATERRFVEGR